MWEELIAKHGHHNNAWVAQIFDCRSIWVRSYIRGKFYTGLHTTSRCEGLHSQMGRWTKKAKNVQGVNFQQCELSRESINISRYGALSDGCRVLCNLASKTKEDFSEMLEKVYNECSRLRSKQNSSSIENVHNATKDQVRDPVRVRAKGRVPGMSSRPKRGNHCGICREIGHNRASCPNVVGSCCHTFENDSEEECLY
ncbi:hypothetical protein Lal_00027001 [Lupinus albus]|nr:hypothetical protein Lal_00027001 [Lupinus albus]